MSKQLVGERVCETASAVCHARKAATLLTCIWKHEDSWLVGAAWGWASRGAVKRTLSL